MIQIEMLLVMTKMQPISLMHFLVNVGLNFAVKIKTEIDSNIFDNMLPASEYMFLEPVLKKEVLTTINQCKNKYSKDFNDISINIIKNKAQTIIEPFGHICNLSFSNGTVPKMKKSAKTLPLFKSGNKFLFTNYRPVALLLQFSKILEKHFCKRLNKFIDRYNLTTENQHGFRFSRSTSSALLEFVEEILSSFEQG